MTFHKKRTNKRHLGSKRHMSRAKKMSRSKKGGFDDEEMNGDMNEVGDPKFDRDIDDIETGLTDADRAESRAEADAESMESGTTMYSPEIKGDKIKGDEIKGDEIKGDEMVGGKAKKSRRHSKKRKAHKTHKRRHARKHSKSHKKK